MLYQDLQYKQGLLKVSTNIAIICTRFYTLDLFLDNNIMYLFNCFFVHSIITGMDGCTTIRVFGKTKHFQNLFKGTVDVNTAAMMNFMASQRWLGARFQILGSFVGLFAALVVVLYNDRLRLETGIIAMLIIWSVNFTITLSFFSQGISEAEAYLTSVERLQDMIHLPQEKDHKTSNSIVLNASWPNKGNLIFDDVCLRYRDGLPLALSGLSFTAKEGQRDKV